MKPQIYYTSFTERGPQIREIFNNRPLLLSSNLT